MQTINRDISGGFIFSSDNKILLGKSNKGGVYQDLWVVPGGGIEPGETAEEAMHREVREETGLEIPESATITSCTDDIQTGESVKTIGGQETLVKMHFYDFIVDIPMPASEIALDPQEELTEVSWVPVDTLTQDTISPGVYYRLGKLGLMQ